MFPTLDDRQSLQQIVLLCRDLYGDDNEKIEDEAKRCIIRVATFQGIIRAQESVAKDKMKWFNEYRNDEKHFNLNKLLTYYFNNWENDVIFNPTQGFNLIVYTFSAMVSTIEDELKNDLKSIEKIINLNHITKKSDFEKRVEDFFDMNNSNNLLIVHADILSDSKNRINMCRSIINKFRMKRLQKLKIPFQLPIKHVCFIIRID